jgi:hypothetical protein
MSEAFIALVIGASQIAKDAILRRAANNEMQKMQLLAHYRKHSEQLVTALLQWGDKMNFSSCGYTDGEISFFEQTHVSGISYLEDAFKHVKKSYPEILESYVNIEDRHKELCKQIDQVMSRESVVPSKPSYENIILSTINRYCPQLRSSNDVSLGENNIFLVSSILNTIFKEVSWEKSQIRLFIEPTSNSRIHQLTDHSRVFAQGTSEDMSNLKNAMEKLLVDNEVIARIREYHELRTQLTSHRDSRELWQKIQRIYDVIHGGKFLGGFEACDLCVPDTDLSQ